MICYLISNLHALSAHCELNICILKEYICDSHKHGILGDKRKLQRMFDLCSKGPQTALFLYIFEKRLKNYSIGQQG